MEDVDFTVIGRLTKAEYTALVQCALASGDLKGRFRNILKKVSY